MRDMQESAALCPFAHEDGVLIECDARCMAYSGNHRYGECLLVKGGAGAGLEAIEHIRDTLRDINATLQYRLS